MRLPFPHKRPVSGIREIPNSDESITTARSHATSINIECHMVDIVLMQRRERRGRGSCERHCSRWRSGSRWCGCHGWFLLPCSLDAKYIPLGSHLLLRNTCSSLLLATGSSITGDSGSTDRAGPFWTVQNCHSQKYSYYWYVNAWRFLDGIRTAVLENATNTIYQEYPIILAGAWLKREGLQQTTRRNEVQLFFVHCSRKP